MIDFLNYIAEYSNFACIMFIILFLFVLGFALYGLITLIWSICDWVSSVNWTVRRVREQLSRSDFERYVDNRIALQFKKLKCQKSTNDSGRK